LKECVAIPQVTAAFAKEVDASPLTKSPQSHFIHRHRFDQPISNRPITEVLSREIVCGYETRIVLLRSEQCHRSLQCTMLFKMSVCC